MGLTRSRFGPSGLSRKLTPSPWEGLADSAAGRQGTWCSVLTGEDRDCVRTGCTTQHARHTSPCVASKGLSESWAEHSNRWVGRPQDTPPRHSPGARAWVDCHRGLSSTVVDPRRASTHSIIIFEMYVMPRQTSQRTGDERDLQFHPRGDSSKQTRRHGHAHIYTHSCRVTKPASVEPVLLTITT
jgi:hypothetical protein